MNEHTFRPGDRVRLITGDSWHNVRGVVITRAEFEAYLQYKPSHLPKNSVFVRGESGGVMRLLPGDLALEKSE